jgi:hypothetical protein
MVITFSGVKTYLNPLTWELNITPLLLVVNIFFKENN